MARHRNRYDKDWEQYRERLYEPSIPIVWSPLPPLLTEAQRQANLERSAEIRASLFRYLER